MMMLKYFRALASINSRAIGHQIHQSHRYLITHKSQQLDRFQFIHRIRHILPIQPILLIPHILHISRSVGLITLFSMAFQVSIVKHGKATNRSPYTIHFLLAISDLVQSLRSQASTAWSHVPSLRPLISTYWPSADPTGATTSTVKVTNHFIIFLLFQLNVNFLFVSDCWRSQIHHQ